MERQQQQHGRRETKMVSVFLKREDTERLCQELRSPFNNSTWIQAWVLFDTRNDELLATGGRIGFKDQLARSSVVSNVYKLTNRGGLVMGSDKDNMIPILPFHTQAQAITRIGRQIIADEHRESE